jgi:hypothetical protein
LAPDTQRAVEGVRDTGHEEVVYNCRVAEYHTYFVGDEGWGFSLWAHNSYLENQYDSVRDLASKAGRFRTLANRLRGSEAPSIAGKNVAVVEYFDPISNSLRTVTRISRGGSAHAERLAIQAIQRRIGVNTAASNITRIFSELSPCGPRNANCSAFISQFAPHARVGWMHDLSRQYLDHISLMRLFQR